MLVGVCVSAFVRFCPVASITLNTCTHTQHTQAPSHTNTHDTQHTQAPSQRASQPDPRDPVATAVALAMSDPKSASHVKAIITRCEQLVLPGEGVCLCVSCKLVSDHVHVPISFV